MAQPRDYKTGKLVIRDKTDKYWFDKGFDDAQLKIRPRNKMAYYLYGYREGKHYRETYEKYTPQNPGYGKAFTFHGSFTSKLLAQKKERQTPGSFIEERGGRYYVLKPKKIRSNQPRSGVKIYGRCLRIEAVKTVNHTYGGKPTGAGQHYFHDFTAKNAKIYGLPNGDLLISTR